MGHTRGRYTFNLQGWEIHPPVELVGDEAEPGPGDVVEINDISLTLDSPGDYRFKTSRRRPGSLLIEKSDGETSVIGVNIDWVDEEDLDLNGVDPRAIVEQRSEDEFTEYLVNPIVHMTDEEMRRLRGIVIGHWIKGLDTELRRLDAARCCLDFHTSTDQSPPTPVSAFRYLKITVGVGNVGDRAAELLRSPLRDLRYLTIGGWSADQAQVDLNLIAECRGLCFLSLAGLELTNVETLKCLRELRHLAVLNCNGISNLVRGDLRSLNKLRRLRLTGEAVKALKGISALTGLTELDLAGTSVTNLEPLRSLRSLRAVKANETPIRKLPGTTLSELRDLRVTSTKLSPRRVEKFRRRNPQTRVSHAWNDNLRNALTTATSLRVRSGAPLDSYLEEERLLVDERDPQRVQALVSRIVVEEGPRGYGCRCDGELCIEFYNDDGYLLSVGLAHGSGLTCPEEWPAQRLLTDDSADFIAEWLEARGVGEFAADRWRKERQAEAAQRRRRKFSEILSPPVVKVVERARNPDRAVRKIERAIPDPVRRAGIAFRLHGCEERSWNRHDNLDSVVVEVLRRIPVQNKSRALQDWHNDERVIRGVARSLFSDWDPDAVDEATLGHFFEPLVTIGLTSPREVNRKATIEALGYLDCKPSYEFLRRVLSGEIEPRELPPIEREEPPGMVLYSGRQRGSDRASAAQALASLGDQSCIEEISRLASTVGGDDGEVYRAALKTLRERGDKADAKGTITDPQEPTVGGRRSDGAANAKRDRMRLFRKKTQKLREQALLKEAGERLIREVSKRPDS